MLPLILGLIGGAVGYATGVGFAIGWFIGSTIGTMIEGQDTEGPRLDDLSAAVSTYNKFIPAVIGTNRLQANFIWMTDLVEVKKKKRSGGFLGIGGSTYTYYQYYGNFAFSLCEGPADVLKIWFNDRLIFDRSLDAGPITDFSYVIVPEDGAGGAVTLNLYPGTETQGVDPTMAKYLGADSTPAYRGQVYVVVRNLPLKDYGNRIPNVSAVVRTGEKADQVEFLSNWYGLPLGNDTNKRISAQGRLIYENGFVTDLVTKAHWRVTDLQAGNQIEDLFSLGSDILDDGTMYWASESYTFSHVYRVNAFTGAWQKLTDSKIGFVDTFHINPETGFAIMWNSLFNASDFRTITNAGGIGGTLNAGGGRIEGATPYDGGFIIVSQGGPYGVAIVECLYSAHVVYQAVELDEAYTIPDNSGVFYHPSTDRLYIAVVNASGYHYLIRLYKDGSVWKMDRKSQRRTNTPGRSAMINGQLARDGHFYGRNGTYGVSYGISPIFKISLDTLEPTEVYNFDTTIGDVLLHPAPSGAIVQYYNGLLYNVWIDRIDPTGVSLQTVTDWLCDMAGIDASMRDTSQMAGETINGYAVNNRDTVRTYIEPLALGFGFDAVESDGIVKFKRRDSVPVGTLTADDLVPNKDGELLTAARTQEQELPYVLDVIYIDPENNWETVTVRAQRYDDLVDTRETKEINLPYSILNSQAINIVARLLHTAWIERVEYEFTLGPDRIALDPADVVTIDLDGQVHTIRIGSTELQGDKSITVKGVSDNLATYTITGTGQGSLADRSDTTLYYVGVPVLIPADLPTVYSDTWSETASFLSVLGSNTGTAWPGMDVSMVTNTDPALRTVGRVVKRGTYGTTTGLVNGASPFVWDDDSTVAVTLTAPADLASPGKDGILADRYLNLALVGGELIQFATATGSGTSWTLSSILRGRFGTEYATSGHGGYEAFMLLDPDALLKAPLDASDTAAQLFGVLGAAETSTAISGIQHRSLMPLSPANVKAELSGADWTITWNRRTRLDGQWTGFEAPLGETTEAYEVDILDVDGVTVKRTLSVTAETATYVEADQVTDFGSIQTIIRANVCQVGAIRGEPAYVTAAKHIQHP